MPSPCGRPGPTRNRTKVLSRDGPGARGRRSRPEFTEQLATETHHEPSDYVPPWQQLRQHPIVSMKKGGLSMALVLWAAGSRGGCLSADCTLDDGAHVRPRVLAIAPSVHLALGFLVRS